MTRKDYVKIAGVIKSELSSSVNDPNMPHNHGRWCATESIAQDLAVVFQSDNDKFDQDKFLEACGL